MAISSADLRPQSGYFSTLAMLDGGHRYMVGNSFSAG
jgi:hypothetical protein